jgi:hypothetical protein
MAESVGHRDEETGAWLLAMGEDPDGVEYQITLAYDHHDKTVTILVAREDDHLDEGEVKSEPIPYDELIHWAQEHQRCAHSQPYSSMARQLADTTRRAHEPATPTSEEAHGH